MLSGLAIDDNDALSQRDQGLEFLEVTSQAAIERIASNDQGGRQSDQYRITNNSQSVVDTHLLIIVRERQPQLAVLREFRVCQSSFELPAFRAIDRPEEEQLVPLQTTRQSG